MEEIEKLVAYYLTTRNVYGIEEVLDILVAKTTKVNYKDIIKCIDNHLERKVESDLTMYLAEIAAKQLPDLETIILEKLSLYSSKSAIEDLKEALDKIKN
ncbi:MAG: hypothetical protein ABJH82_06970 [Polaribacter sp.]|uniref:hypothetical protein n=1 Tax=Polaribacter sp. TaxID=1920175 RepID=UPI003265EFDC